MTEPIVTNTPRGPNDPRHDPDWRNQIAEGDPKTKYPARDPLLVEREKPYGDFKIQGAFAHQLKFFFRDQSGYARFTDAQKEALDMIATKISRLLHGDPFVKDSWIDIAGYAKLGSEACDK